VDVAVAEATASFKLRHVSRGLMKKTPVTDIHKACRGHQLLLRRAAIFPPDQQSSEQNA
jgi:hypothetical protein